MRGEPRDQERRPLCRATGLTHLLGLYRVWNHGDKADDVIIVVNGDVVGAVGVSGVKSAEDAQIAKAGIAALGL